MGEIISIQEKTGEIEFRIGYSATFEERIVTLDDDKRELFFTRDPVSSMACPFLREKYPGRVICTVHDSRPELCRQYSCFRILVLDQEGKPAGRVLYRTRSFSSPDARLNAIWQQDCRQLDIRDENTWEEEVAQTFKRAGWLVVK